VHREGVAMARMFDDAMRRRSATFWLAGRKGEWPLETGGYVFLGNAVLRLGSAMFPKSWTGSEPFESALPFLDGQKPVFVDGFDAEYAAGILLDHRPDLAASDEQTRLTENQWSATFDIFRSRLAGPRKAAVARMQAVKRAMTEAAADGVIDMATRMAPLTWYIQTPPSHWATEKALARFSECQMSPSQPYQQALVSIEELTFPAGSYRPLLSLNAWIFVSGESLEAFCQRLVVAQPSDGQSDAGDARPSVRPRGRKPKYDWAAFRNAAHDKLAYEGGISSKHDVSFTQAALELFMAEWASTAWTEVPSPSTIRVHVSEAIDTFEVSSN
jgi:hypothetical protein